MPTQTIGTKFKVAVVDYRAPDAAKRFTDSLKTTGFAVLTNHPVSNDLIQDVYTEWRDLMIRLNEHAAHAQLDKSVYGRHGWRSGEGNPRT